MSPLVICPAPWSGILAAPPSKSIAHRALLAAALARGVSRITGLELSQDIRVSIGVIQALGAQAEILPREDGLYDVRVAGLTPGVSGTLPDIDCGESGNMLRFAIAVALYARGGGVFHGSPRLMQRNMEPYADLFAEKGIQMSCPRPSEPLIVRGTLQSGDYRLAGNVSSQFFTGLLLVLPLLQGDSTLASIGPLESQPYVDITCRVLAQFGVPVQSALCGNMLRIAGGQAYAARAYAVEGDWSQAAALLVGGLVGGGVSVGNLSADSTQGDRVIESILRTMGARLSWQESRLVAQPSALHAADVDISDCPDLAPALSAAMAVASGVSRIRGGARLRYKESDRIAAICAVVNALGGDAAPTADGLVIVGREQLRGGVCDASNDHRIAMMAAVLSARCEQDVVLNDHQSVNKTWPGFWNAVEQLGGSCHEQ